MSKIASGIVLFSLLMALSLGVAFADAGMGTNNSTVVENNTTVIVPANNTTVEMPMNNSTEAAAETPKAA
jgi:hypothetical protein